MKTRKESKVLKDISIIIMSLVILYKLFDIYAAYKTKRENNYNTEILPWTIIINDTNISENKQFFLKDIYTLNKNTDAGKIAPGTIIQIPIRIDASNVKKMNVKYEIEVNINNNDIGEVIIQKVEETNGTELVQLKDNLYTGIITDEEINNGIIHDIRIDIEWLNDEKNNEKDTIKAMEEKVNNIKIDIKVKAMQYMADKDEDIQEGLNEENF